LSLGFSDAFYAIDFFCLLGGVFLGLQAVFSKRPLYFVQIRMLERVKKRKLSCSRSLAARTNRQGFVKMRVAAWLYLGLACFFPFF